MARRTLIDFFADLGTLQGDFLTYDDGYRTWSYTYAQLASASQAFAARLRTEQIAPGQTVVVWGENRPEWIVALWGCLLEGVILVPIDYRASAAFLSKVADIVSARAILVGQIGEHVARVHAAPRVADRAFVEVGGEDFDAPLRQLGA